MIAFVVVALLVAYGLRRQSLRNSALVRFLSEGLIAVLWAAVLWLAVPLFPIPLSATDAWALSFIAYQSALMALERGVGQSRDARLSWVFLALLIFCGVASMLENPHPIFDDLKNEGLFPRNSGSLYTQFQWHELVYSGLAVCVVFIGAAWRLRSAFLVLLVRMAVVVYLLAIAAQLGTEVDWFLRNGRGVFWQAIAAELWLTGLGLVVATAATLQSSGNKGTPGCRGLIPLRHMVTIRRIWRLAVANAARLPLVGGLIAVLSAFVGWMRFANGDRGYLHSRDFMILAAHLYGIVVTVILLRSAFGFDPRVWCCKAAFGSAFQFASMDIAFVIAWCAWGVLLYLRGVMLNDAVARLFAPAFVLFPLAMYGVNNSVLETHFLALVSLLCGLSLFALGILRRLARQ